jgi:hypothetical protein
MINYIFINNQYWQKGKLIGIYNKDNYIFELDGRNENIQNENLRVTTDRGEGTSVSLFEIFPNIFIEAVITSTKGSYVTLNITNNFYDYTVQKLAKTSQIKTINYM